MIRGARLCSMSSDKISPLIQSGLKCPELRLWKLWRAQSLSFMRLLFLYFTIFMILKILTFLQLSVLTFIPKFVCPCMSCVMSGLNDLILDTFIMGEFVCQKKFCSEQILHFQIRKKVTALQNCSREKGGSSFTDFIHELLKIFASSFKVQCEQKVSRS